MGSRTAARKEGSYLTRLVYRHSVILVILLLITTGCSFQAPTPLSKFQIKPAALETSAHSAHPEETPAFPDLKPISTSTITLSPMPTEIVFEIGQELTVKYLREMEIRGSEIIFHERLSPGYSYARHLVSYSSEGNQVYGLLTIPFTEPPEGGYKAIVFNHGYIPPRCLSNYRALSGLCRLPGPEWIRGL
ncbi:MAG: hypothetical protein DRJ13_15990 [Bacteroidetes bacterium]|nr:MAG: hypothetical protein DRJ13_15990 [Bacteroidota bacterium]